MHTHVSSSLIEHWLTQSLKRPRIPGTIQHQSMSAPRLVFPVSLRDTYSCKPQPIQTNISLKARFALLMSRSLHRFLKKSRFGDTTQQCLQDPGRTLSFAIFFSCLSLRVWPNGYCTLRHQVNAPDRKKGEINLKKKHTHTHTKSKRWKDKKTFSLQGFVFLLGNEYSSQGLPSISHSHNCMTWLQNKVWGIYLRGRDRHGKGDWEL